MTLSVLHSQTLQQSYLDWVELPLVVTDDSPDQLLHLQPFVEGAPRGGVRIVKVDGPIRLPRALLGPLASLIGAKSDETKAYISLSADLNNDVQVSIIAVDESGGTPVAEDGSARIAGTVKIDGVAAARDVVVISDDPGGRKVVGEGASESDGTFDITYIDWTGPVIALALDNYGQDWEAEANLNNGTVVHPTQPNGYVYRVTSAGTTGTTEPTWPTGGSVTDGGVTYETKPYYRPVASGPLRGEEVEPPAWTPAELFANSEDGAWYDPSDISTLFIDTSASQTVQADGDPVALMLDKSGNMNHVIQETVSKRPIYRTDGVNHWLEFNGSSHYMETASSDSMGHASGLVYAVSADFDDRTSINNSVLSRTANGVGRDWFFKRRAGLDKAASVFDTDLEVVSNPLPDGLVSIVTTWDGSEVAHYVEGSLDTAAPKTTLQGSDANRLAVGVRRRSSVYEEFLKGKLYSLVLRGENTEGQELAELESYILERRP